MKKIKKIFYPVILIWRDKVIDIEGFDQIDIPAIYIGKGRVLTLSGLDQAKRFEIHVNKNLFRVRGDIRMQKKPKEISVEDIRRGPIVSTGVGESMAKIAEIQMKNKVDQLKELSQKKDS